uniref:Uncharacterized protein AlNc14C173G8054 n=1 Tax=Albugo laibachii Nc14 TaxID=890382 RepID=F0WNN3_9STRA|nr:hypothetical protein MPER_12479 [Albugo laibachii Nc14]|eukprot:CCA22924.1 hypothetical protein MPER_12479 [Albugo laibachii Nc14]
MDIAIVWSSRKIQGSGSIIIKHNDLLSFKSQPMMRVCLPHTKDDYLRASIISCFHDSNIAAHPGAQRKLLRISQWYHRLTLNQDVPYYVQSCETSTRWKHSNARKYGKMIPIPIPEECWLVFSMDFITGLSNSYGFDAIMTVVDKLAKHSKYRVCNSTDDAQTSAFHFFDCVVRHHELPSIIISDRHSKFVLKFCSSLAKLMEIRQHMTASYPTQTDGQTKRQNLILEDDLRFMVSCHGRYWSDHFGTIMYAHATLVSASTGMSPFEFDTGRKECNPLYPLSSLSSTRQVQHGIAEYAKHSHDLLQEIIDVVKNITFKLRIVKRSTTAGKGRLLLSKPEI